MRRRAFLAGTASALTLGSVGTATASHTPRHPADVEITYDQATLDTYKPHLAFKQADREKLLGLYGWVARSESRDTDVCVFWCSYSYQDGNTSYTSHRGDHEPVAVEFDPDSGDVQRIRASVWHWQKGETTPDATRMDGTHPQLRVINPHHAYTVASESDATEVLDVADLTNAWDDWLTNGLQNDVVVGASYNPWTMRSESDWWRAGSFGLPSTEALVTDATQRYSELFDPASVGSLQA